MVYLTFKANPEETLLAVFYVKTMDNELRHFQLKAAVQRIRSC
jgi:hypothetical protein